MLIKKNCVVTSQFELFDKAGELIDSSAQGGPLEYLHGAGELLPKLEAALDGCEPGARLTVELGVDDAFGEHDPSLVEAVPRENFPGVEVIEPGMRFETQMDDGSPMLVVVTEVSPDSVTVDGNHELAGRDLRFELEVIDVRAATTEEVAHGHVHSHGECEH